MSETSHPRTREDLIAQLKNLSAADFASQHLLDRVPWIFSTRGQYIDWKTNLAADLELDPFMLLVVGSAALGFSLSPLKSFASFSASSDIDVAAVSQRHFEEAWRWLRELGPDDLVQRDALEREMFKWHRRNLVFDGAIATDKLLSRLPFGSKWTSGLSHASSREPTDGRSIKVRIYRDFESLRKYHVTNIRQLQLGLITEDIDVSPARLPQLHGENLEGSPRSEDATS